LLLALQAHLAFDSPHDGLTKWTIVHERPIDETLFRNRGWSCWEVETEPKGFKKPIKSAVCCRRSHSPRPCAPRFTPGLIGHGIELTSKQIYSAAESSPIHANSGKSTPPVAPVPSSAQPPSAPATASVEPPLPPLTANAIAGTQAASPTNVALEKSVDTSSSVSDKLNAALAEIDRLRQQLSEAQGPLVTGLRKRGAGAQAGAETAIETAVEKGKEVVAAAQGVPIEVVGGLVLVVFVLTYLFF
jgi:hypothetical protein